MALRVTGLLLSICGFAFTIWCLSHPLSNRGSLDEFYVEAITDHIGHRIAFTPIQSADDRELARRWDDRLASILHVYADKAYNTPVTGAFSGALIQLVGALLIVLGLWLDRKNGILTKASMRPADAAS